MADYQSLPFGQRIPWQEVLQKPYVTVDLDVGKRRQAMWNARQNEHQTLLSGELAALTTALQNERDKKMADLIAADAKRAAGRGGGGGGGRGGGGGKAPATLLPTTPIDNGDWYDQVAAAYANQAAPPQPNFHLQPSTAYGGPNNVYGYTAPTPNPSRLARAKKVTPPKAYSRSKVVLS